MRYTVKGNRAAGFPIDMLRYDRAWPASSADAALIAALIAREGIEELSRTVRVNLESENNPTKARWASFLWRVEIQL